MGLSLIAYNNENDCVSFYLGSYTALFSQISNASLKKMLIFRWLIDEADSEDEFYIENKDLKCLIDEIQQLLDEDNIYLSNNLRESLRDFLLFFKSENLNSWKVSIA